MKFFEFDDKASSSFAIIELELHAKNIQRGLINMLVKCSNLISSYLCVFNQKAINIQSFPLDWNQIDWGDFRI